MARHTAAPFSKNYRAGAQARAGSAIQYYTDQLVVVHLSAAADACVTVRGQQQREAGTAPIAEGPSAWLNCMCRSAIIA
jgi:hypothetical protein